MSGRASLGLLLRHLHFALHIWRQQREADAEGVIAGGELAGIKLLDFVAQRDGGIETVQPGVVVG